LVVEDGTFEGEYDGGDGDLPFGQFEFIGAFIGDKRLALVQEIDATPPGSGGGGSIRT